MVFLELKLLDQGGGAVIPEDNLVLPTGETDALGNYIDGTVEYLPALGKTPGTFRIAYPHQYNQFATQSAFFYEDGAATFLVQPIRRSEVAAGGGTVGGVGGTVGGTFSAGIPHTHGIAPDDVGRIFPLALARTLATAEIQPDENGGGNTAILAVLGDGLANIPFAASANNPTKKFRFLTHYHPLTEKFLAGLFNEGVDGVMGRLDLQSEGSKSLFANRYSPDSRHVHASHPLSGVDYSYEGAYSVYNWELFFHIPLLVADRLRQEHRFEEAQRWYHYIFDPTRCEDGNPPQCYWKVRLFFEYDLSDPESRPMQELMNTLSEGNAALANQVEVWRENPFSPHAIARLRTIAYQKTVVMKYLDNLIAWADALFRQDTLETLNEATQLYLIAAQVLGRRPEEIDTGQHPPAKTFNDLSDTLDPFSNTLVNLEEHLAPSGIATVPGGISGGSGTSSSPPPLGTTLFFCIPKNEKLLAYWDTVEDRLFKIRNCMNIEGVTRTLPLFQPPIDPALLVRAAAAGVDINSAVNDLSAPFPHYRFHFLMAKALELTNVVKSLGSALLDAIGQRDAEALAFLRATHEVELLKAIREVKNRNVNEATEHLAALGRSRQIAEERRLYYDGRPARNAEETDQLDELEDAGTSQGKALDHDLASADAARFIPDFSVGFSGMGPHATVSLGRANILAFYQFRSQEKSAESAKASHASTLAGTRGAWNRRQDDWTFQAAQALAETRQIDKQIAAAEIRQAIARKELDAHDRQTAQAEAVEFYMRDKFTDAELHNWRASQLSTLFFQSYQLAHDLGQRAERAFHRELGTDDTAFVEFGNWDNVRKGLLSGERLELQLRRLESAHMEQNRRELEITKNVSLAAINPMALLRLKEGGFCEFELPEALFDLDYPGHYFRRIKSVSITIPAVTGPYTTLSCTLRLLRSSIRRQATLPDGQYARNLDDDDPRFSDSFGTIQSIATSTGQYDSGLFELNFRDERYLPFESAGAISRWQLEMPSLFPQFDYDTISDVILQVKYTARDGGNVLRNAANGHISATINSMLNEAAATGTGFLRWFSLKREFPTALHQLQHPAQVATPTTGIIVEQRHFPYFLRGRALTLENATVFLKPHEGEALSVSGLEPRLNAIKPETDWTLFPDAQSGPLASIDIPLLGQILEPEGNPLIITSNQGLPPVEDIWLLVAYTVGPA